MTKRPQTKRDLFPRVDKPTVDKPFRSAWRALTMGEKKMIERQMGKGVEKMTAAEVQTACIWAYECRDQNPKPPFDIADEWTQEQVDDYFADDPLEDQEVSDKLGKEQ